MSKDKKNWFHSKAWVTRFEKGQGGNFQLYGRGDEVVGHITPDMVLEMADAVKKMR